MRPFLFLYKVFWPFSKYCAEHVFNNPMTKRLIVQLCLLPMAASQLTACGGGSGVDADANTNNMGIQKPYSARRTPNSSSNPTYSLSPLPAPPANPVVATPNTQVAGSSVPEPPANVSTPDMPAASSAVPSGYALVWSDEFNSTGPQLPDSSKWAYDIEHNQGGWFNGERQYYSNARLENSSVQNGKLVITARKENLAGRVTDWGNQQYTSARMFTRGKQTWTYGFFEIRAKLPCGTGTWPAIWTLGSAPPEIWPDQGEIDIMEQTGWDKGPVLGTIHTLAGSGRAGPTGSTALPDACTAFHNYQIKWTPDEIVFYVDGNTYRDLYNKPADPRGWPFDKPQYLLLNVAVGGTLGGDAVNDATLSDTSLEVDYVRVYQKAVS